MLLHSARHNEFSVGIPQNGKKIFKGTQKENIVLLQYKS